jgi:hypothetical protein
MHAGIFHKQTHKGSMMNQFLVFHFNINKNDKNFQLMMQPGCSYEEVAEVLEQFKVEFVELQRLAKEKEEADKAAAEKQVEEVQPEVVEKN